jgi:hypothetical protein
MNSNTHILICPKHLPVAVEFAGRSHQRFVLAHLAKSPIKTGELRRWEVAMRELARLPNVILQIIRAGDRSRGKAGSENSYGLEPSPSAISSQPSLAGCTVVTMFHSGLCDQPQSFSFGAVAHCAGRIKVHRCPLFRSVCGPMRQPAVIRIAGSGEIHPSSTDLLR